MESCLLTDTFSPFHPNVHHIDVGSEQRVCHFPYTVRWTHDDIGKKTSWRLTYFFVPHIPHGICTLYTYRYTTARALVLSLSFQTHGLCLHTLQAYVTACSQKGTNRSFSLTPQSSALIASCTVPLASLSHPTFGYETWVPIMHTNFCWELQLIHSKIAFSIVYCITKLLLKKKSNLTFLHPKCVPPHLIWCFCSSPHVIGRVERRKSQHFFLLCFLFCRSLTFPPPPTAIWSGLCECFCYSYYSSEDKQDENRHYLFGKEEAIQNTVYYVRYIPRTMRSILVGFTAIFGCCCTFCPSFSYFCSREDGIWPLEQKWDSVFLAHCVWDWSKMKWFLSSNFQQYSISKTFLALQYILYALCNSVQCQSLMGAVLTSSLFLFSSFFPHFQFTSSFPVPLRNSQHASGVKGKKRRELEISHPHPLMERILHEYNTPHAKRREEQLKHISVLSTLGEKRSGEVKRYNLYRGDRIANNLTFYFSILSKNI